MLIDVLFVLAALGLIFTIYKIKFSKENLQQQIHQARQEKAREAPPPPQEKQEETNANSEQEGWQNSDSEDEEGLGQGSALNSRKQLVKEQKRKQKQQRKQAQEQYLQQQKERREKYEKEAEERERQEEERRRREEEVIQQLREAERRRKEEEFNQWKNMFSVEETGKHQLSEEEERRRAEAFNRQLLGVLKGAKLSLLEDLSHKFKVSTKEMVERIRQLEGEGAVSGIFDERGKYLVIEAGEWEAIKRYISARGRVKKSDIMVECAKLITIPDTLQEDLLTLVAEEEEKAT